MSQALKDARLSHDPPLRLIDVAKKAGCSVSLVCMVEKGYCPPRATREALAEAVGASYGAFWGLEAGPKVVAVTNQIRP